MKKQSLRLPYLYLDAEQDQQGRWVAFGYCVTNQNKYFGDFDGKILFDGTKEEVLANCISHEDRSEALNHAETGWFVKWLAERASSFRDFNELLKRPKLRVFDDDQKGT